MAADTALLGFSIIICAMYIVPGERHAMGTETALTQEHTLHSHNLFLSPAPMVILSVVFTRPLLIPVHQETNSCISGLIE